MESCDQVAVDDVNEVIQALLGVDGSVALVFHVADAQAGHPAAVGGGKMPRRAAVSRADVQHPGLGPQPLQLCAKMLHGALAGHGDGFTGIGIDADMDVHASPHVKVKAVRGVAVVIILGGLRRLGRLRYAVAHGSVS